MNVTRQQKMGSGEETFQLQPDEYAQKESRNFPQTDAS
ncbi:hypothetical protein Poly51_13250 [Rubripirellula tenax]|uniref:Uncharacterized protein n=1 Tax=Rubripirellula tenax TaxID=2528015 RepID=A0A5C6FEK7_9BACT|nr:hypothetical protein Poly51_13250 [Rubripirellula tenax]